MHTGIPDYPPPSFQEAIGTPEPGCLSLTSLLPGAVSTASEDNPSPSEPSLPTATTRMEIDPVNEAAASDNGSESDDSGMVIINKNEVPVCSTDLPPAEKVKKDWFKRSKVEFPNKSTPNPGKVDEQPRGRNSARPTLQINPYVASGDYLSGNASPSSPKRRFLSLAPIRTIFPSRSAVQQDRAMSATASPVSPKSPYSTSKLFFRSTSSLSAASLLRLPLSPTSSGSKTESLPRRLFSYKGKERAKDFDVPEELEDNWEVLDKAVEGEKEKLAPDAGAEKHPQSLMSIVVDSMSNDGSTATLSKNPQTKPIQTPSDRPQVNTLSHHVAKDDSKSPLVQETIQSHNVDEISPTNSSQSGMEAQELPSGSSTPIATSPTSSVPQPHSLLSRSQWVPSSTSTHRPVPSPSPLRVSTLPIVSMEPYTATTEEDTNLKALPMTPVYHNHFEQRAPPLVDDLKEKLSPPLVPVAAWRSPAACSIPDLLTNVNPIPSAEPITLCACSAKKNVTTVMNEMSPSPLGFSVYPRLSTPTLMETDPSEDEFPTPSRHYVGRPLPPPPAINASMAKQNLVVAVKNDSPTTPCSPAYHSADPDESENRGDAECLLIDLEDTSLDVHPHSPSSTVRDESCHPSQIFLPLVSSPSSSVDLSRECSASELSDLSFTSPSTQSTNTIVVPVQLPPGRAPSPLHHQRHQCQHHSQLSLPLSHQRRNLLRPPGLLPRFGDGLHDTMCYGVSPGHHVRRVDLALSRDNNTSGHCCSFEPHSAISWSPSGLTSPSLVSIPTFGCDVYQSQHCNPYLPADTTQRQRHITHLSY